MRRSAVFVVVAVIGLLLASAAPAAGGAAEKTEYFGVECFTADFTNASFKFAGETTHTRGGEGTADEYLWDWDAEDWVPAGANATVINFNEGPSGGHNWGTFAIQLDGIGEFEGTWSGERATGKATDGSGRLIKVDLAPDPAEFPALPPGDFCGPPDFEPPVLKLPPLLTKSVVIDPHA